MDRVGGIRYENRSGKSFDDGLVETVAGSLLGSVRSPVLERAFDYWKSIDPNIGRRIEQKVRSGGAAEPSCGHERKSRDV